MITQSLPGIISLGYVVSDRLQSQMECKALAGILVELSTDITPINFVGNPTCETINDFDNNGRLEKSTLRFLTNDNIPIYKSVAFVMTDANGESWLLGTREKPHPIIKVTKNTGVPDGEPSAYSFEVTLYAHKALVACEV